MRSRLFPVIIFLTGFCSLIYELALAQLLSGLFGNTALRYASTLGVYILSMGVGSFVFKSKSPVQDLRLLYKAEMLIAVLGMLSPFLFVLVNFAFISFLTFESAQMPILIFTHLFIALCGFISGFEIPILASLYQQELGEKKDSQVLAWDYLGMFLASLCFPLLLFPVFGIFSSFWVTTLANLFCVFLILWLDQNSALAKKYLWFSLCLLAFNLILLWQSENLRRYFSEVYSHSF